MSILLNGESHKLNGDTTIDGLLAELQLDKQPILVEHNGEPLLPKEFATTSLSDGDKIELIRMVAGG